MTQEILKWEFYHLVRGGISWTNLGMDRGRVIQCTTLGDSVALSEAIFSTLNLG